MAHIKLQNVGVTFPIYNAKTRSIRNTVIKAVGGRIQSIDNTIYVKALDNINLEINQGDRIGLVGHNGAGKSTLLKILSNRYEPTEGRSEIEGDIYSLTDITLGMDPESSGYENILMRCIFMGLTFKEAKNKVNEIVEFSELSDYIHLPIRTYSSGMYLRLAFSIATSTIPSILIMDEMIGAGDASFIEKAKKRIMDLIQATKIMVIASHDPQMMKNICNRGIWMEKGRIIMDGKIDQVIQAYQESLNT